MEMRQRARAANLTIRYRKNQIASVLLLAMNFVIASWISYFENVLTKFMITETKGLRLCYYVI